MTAMVEETEKRRVRTKTTVVSPSGREGEKNGLKRHRSLHEKKNEGNTTREDTIQKITMNERSISPIYTFVSELNFTKIVNQFINSPAARKTALLLQALRQQVTVCKSSEYAVRTIGIYAEKDVLTLKNRKHSAVATILNGTENAFEVKDQLCRFINSFASFKRGRNYLLGIGGGKELFTQIFTGLRTRRIYGSAQDHAVAALQKLSIRPFVCRDLLSLGAFEWLLPAIESARMSAYGIEFATALLLNLTLCANSPSLIARHSDQILSCLSTLLRMKNPSFCPLINGALYAALAFGRIRARARETKFHIQLQLKLERADCSIDTLHIPFLMKQMKGEVEMVRIAAPSTSDDYEDMTTDNCEGDIDSTDQLVPIGAELAGARLLLAKVLSDSATSATEDCSTKEEAEEESRGPPGTVSRSRVRRGRPINKTRPLSRSEPRRTTSATSQATFTVESDVRKPLIQPISLSQMAVALKNTMEKEKKGESKENIKDDRMKEIRTTRGQLRRSISKNEGELASKEETIKTERQSSSRISPIKPIKPLNKSLSMIDAKVKSEVSSPTQKEEVKEVKVSSSPFAPERRIPLRVKEQHDDKMSSPPIPSSLNLLSQLSAPVRGTVPARIPDDANALDYISVFGSRPKVPRTPEREKKQSSVLLY